MILPLTTAALESKVFLQQRLWPDFGSDGAVLELPPLKWLVTTRHTIA